MKIASCFLALTFAICLDFVSSSWSGGEYIPEPRPAQTWITKTVRGREVQFYRPQGYDIGVRLAGRANVPFTYIQGHTYRVVDRAQRVAFVVAVDPQTLDWQSVHLDTLEYRALPLLPSTL